MQVLIHSIARCLFDFEQAPKHSVPNDFDRYMKPHPSLAVAALLAGLLVSCFKGPAHVAWTSSASMVVEPWIAIGTVRSGMTIPQVVAELAEPDRKQGEAI